MRRKENSLWNILRIVVIILLLFGIAAGTAEANFYFRGYTYNETNVTLNNTNVSIEIYLMGGQSGPSLINTNYTSSNATGFFNISINGSLDSQDYMYRPVLKHYLDDSATGTLDWIGQSLPQFPNGMISDLTRISPMNFYLRKGGTIYINASGLNQTGIVVPVAFKYMIKDTKMGYPITSNFSSEQLDVGPIHVPLERNYSIMIFPNRSLPVSYELNNLSDYTGTNYTANINLNTSIRPLWVSGYANLSDGTSNFTDLNMIAYLMEPGNMVGKDHPMPSNMSAFRFPQLSDTYNATNGSYNITLPGSAQGAGANILLFATAYNNTAGEYYGAFKNITMSYSGSDADLNFTLYPLLGSPKNISVNNMGLMGQPQNITTNMLPFQLKNGSDGSNISAGKFAHVEIQVNYSANDSAAFKWMLDVSQTDNGSFFIPAFNANIEKINVFMQDFAPLKTSRNTTQLATVPVNISMNSFENKKPDGGQLSGIRMKMLLSKPECDRPIPASGCSLINEQTQGEFSPFKIVLGGGKISMRIKQESTGIKVHYKNVDMLASGPPDALFEENASSSRNGSVFEQAWRFGSQGPEIYDEVLIGIPLGSVIPNNVSVELGKLYDENWNTVWNSSAGGTVDNLPSDYSTFNTTWFNSTTGMPCSTSDQTAPCYLDITNRTVWLTFPHFSGVGPAVSGTAGNFTATLTDSIGIAGTSVAMNFTMNDTSNATSWYNITFPGDFDASGSIVNISINGSADPLEWTKSNGTSFVNISSSTVSANISEYQYINISNITLPQTTGNKTINITTNSGLTISLNYTVVNYDVNLTANRTTANTGETMNATYTLILQNNGTGTDTYNLTVSQGGASTAALNVTGNITLASMATQTLLLNVTNTTGSTVPFYVNVTARSNNDTTKVGYINTTTTVNSVTGSVNGTVTDFWFSNLQISGVTITLTNTTGGTYSNTTDSSGYYYISGVVTRISNPYIYTISTSKANYTTNASATVTVLNSTTNSTTNITLRAYNGTLGGSYIKYGTSIEVSGARVNITNSTFGSIIRTTDSSGSYSVSLYPAIYTINVSKEGYSSNSTSAAVSSNLSTTVSTIPLSPNTVTITANRTVGWADSGQNVSFNLTVVNTGDNATFSVITSDTNANVTNTTTPSPLLLNISNSTGYVVVEVNSTFGGWPVTITISNSSKSADVTLTAIMRNSSANYTNDSSSVILNSSVTGGAILRNTNVMNSTVIGAALENTTVQNGANVSGNDTFIKNATVTGNHTEITDGAVIRGDYGNSYIDNSSVGNATVVSSNLTGSTFVRSNSMVTNSTLVGATVDNSTLTNVTVRADSIIMNVANLNNITLGGVTVTGDLDYEYEGKIAGGNGWATYQNINFTKVYDSIRISQLVIEQSPNTNVGSGMNISINDTSLGTSMNFSMTVNLTNPAVINISETGISPDGAGFSSGTRLGNFLYIRSNDTNNSNVTSHILRLYFDTDPTTFTEGVAMYYYNTTASTPVWEKLITTASGNLSGRWYIETAPNHFSTYALLGTTGGDDGDGDSGSGSGSSGSGGGGGGGKSDENATNIEVIEKYDLEISKAALTSYRFKETGNPIMFVNITGNASIGVVTATVEVLKGTSTLVKVPPDGLVYKNANIWVGTTGMATPKNIKEALIKFKVENSWMSANGVVAKDIVLVKWDGSSWIKLETKVSSKDDTNTYIEGKTNSFSPFAITATVAEAKTTVTQTPASTGSPTPGGTTPAPAEESDVMTWIIGLIIVVIIGAAVYFLVVKKNE